VLGRPEGHDAVVQTLDVATVQQALYADGVFGQKGAFSREWAAELGEDLAVLFQEAIRTPNGALGRGPRRYYIEIHPERLRGFREIATNPWIAGVCERVLGSDYQSTCRCPVRSTSRGTATSPHPARRSRGTDSPRSPST
jgi:hypothetical protein